MTFPPTILWDFFGSPDILGYMEMKLPMGSKRRGLFTSLMDQNLPCKYLGRILER
jgi:hypothetical protein